MRRIGLLIGLTLVAGLGSGCRPYRLKPPSGFAEVERDKYGTRMKAGDDVGLNLRVFDNVRGGDLAFWSEDLVRKLGKRGYVLLGQHAERSDNGVVGTRFDFSYVPPGSEDRKFYSAVLFVTDAHVFVVQLAGNESVGAAYTPRIDAIASDTTVRGCRAWTKVCRGPQPPKLATPTGASATIAESATDTSKPAADASKPAS